MFITHNIFLIIVDQHINSWLLVCLPDHHLHQKLFRRPCAMSHIVVCHSKSTSVDTNGFLVKFYPILFFSAAAFCMSKIGILEDDQAKHFWPSPFCNLFFFKLPFLQMLFEPHILTFTLFVLTWCRHFSVSACVGGVELIMLRPLTLTLRSEEVEKLGSWEDIKKCWK